MRVIEYPFVPKTTAYLKAGHFWDIPLSNNRYACGRVLQLGQSGPGYTKMIFAGLMDWQGKQPPTTRSIAHRPVLEQGVAHIQTIVRNGGVIRGWRSLDDDAIVVSLELDSAPSRNCRLVRGFELLGWASLEEMQFLYTQRYWGPTTIKILAEAHFVKKAPPVRRLPWHDYEALIKRHPLPSQGRGPGG